MNETLNQYLEWFYYFKPYWLQNIEEYQNKFALIGKCVAVSYHSSYEEAITNGYQKFGIDSVFLVKKIEVIETIHRI